jgi:hypothetical protein
MKIQFSPTALKGNCWSVVNSFTDRTLGEISVSSLCSDKNPLSGFAFHSSSKQFNDLFIFFPFAQTEGISIVFKLF